MRDNTSGTEPTGRGQGQGPKELPELSDDRLYRALSSRRRRRLLYVLLVEQSSSLEKLVTVLTGWTATENQELATSEDRKRIMAELDHVHLPVLKGAGLVDYDREKGIVEIVPLDETVARLISQSVETETTSQS